MGHDILNKNAAVRFLPLLQSLRERLQYFVTWLTGRIVILAREIWTLRGRMLDVRLYIYTNFETLSAFQPELEIPRGGWSVVDGDGNIMHEEMAAIQPYENWVHQKTTLLLGYEVPRERRPCHRSPHSTPRF
eukprot:Protomagalhaensia_sp_Gyna_25__1933@NODE_2026_length_1338_cov_7_670516_g1671_i0_p2_GENE_NODE_2026_length_1338_cov_7_670516_g1671_i0NODE_2026_length_1338_cov_7_670516_g1671_i0_p2_ORF_typecomplete_len132_score12_01_NODE_2026_length_1338_cov_7_670516_g1671_i0365760